MIEIPNYTIERELGRGGMATVYLAVQDMLSRHVALKVMLPDMARDENFRKSFLSEGKIIANLEHPNVVRIHDVGVIDDSILYMAMEYLAGGTLKEKLTQGKLSYAEALATLEQTASGLEYAHSKGYIHRDVKPGNILFRDNGTCVITDFGIAKLQDTSGELTRMGYTMGTVQYMSPEQAITTDLDQRSDIYSLGLVFYEMLTGKKAFKAESTIQAIHQHTTVAPPELPAEYSFLQPTIDKVLAKEPDDRYQSANEFVEAVRDAANVDKTVIHKVPTSSDEEQTQIFEATGSIAHTQENRKSNKGLFAGIAGGAILLGAVAFGITKYPDFIGGKDKDIVVNNTPPQKGKNTEGINKKEKLEKEQREREIAAQQKEQELKAEQLEKEKKKVKQEEQAKLMADQKEQDQLKAEQLEKEKQRLKQEEQNKLLVEQKEKERLKVEELEKEKERLKQEEQDKLLAEQKEQERLKTEELEKEKERLKQEEQDKLLAEQKEQDRLKAEKETAEKQEKERIAAASKQKEIDKRNKEKKAALAKEKAEKARIKKNAAKKKAEKDRKRRELAARKKAAQDKIRKSAAKKKADQARRQKAAQLAQRKKAQAVAIAKKKAAARARQQQAKQLGQIQISVTLNGKPLANTKVVISQNGKTIRTVTSAKSNNVLRVGRYVLTAFYGGKSARAAVNLGVNETAFQRFAFKGSVQAPKKKYDPWEHSHGMSKEDRKDPIEQYFPK